MYLNLVRIIMSTSKKKENQKWSPLWSSIVQKDEWYTDFITVEKERLIQ